MQANPYGVMVGLLVLMGVPSLEAQETDQQEAGIVQAAESQEDVIGLEVFRVIGSRVAGRSAQDSPVPVDIIRGEDLQTYGIRDMDSLLSATVPSYNVNQQPISDAATLVRPANLRGLPPDSTLVLVNGKRRHRASVITFLGGGISDGSHAPDISVIPAIALEQVEVLRDGAAAQYGSDAIAGILNFKLREDSHGLSLHTSWGQHYHGDGDKVQVAANLGLPLTEAGFANFSFEFLNADETSRSVQRDDARGLIEAGNAHVRRPAAQIWGAPEIQYDYKFFGNLGLDLEAIKARLYAFGNYAERKVEGGFFFRNPNTRGGVFRGDPLADGTPTVRVADLSGSGFGCPAVPANPAADYTGVDLPEHCFLFNERFPGGFTPRFGGTIQDWSIAFGLRGELESAYSLLNGWFYDASASFGHNSVDFFMHNTINPQLAAMRTAIPTSYRPGGYREFDRVFNFDISRPFDLGVFTSPLNFAFGLEYREEEFEVEAGGQNSWYIDDREHGLARQGFGVASNGFPGFRPDIAGTFDRGSYAGYLDLGAKCPVQAARQRVGEGRRNRPEPVGGRPAVPSHRGRDAHPGGLHRPVDRSAGAAEGRPARPASAARRGRPQAAGADGRQARPVPNRRRRTLAPRPGDAIPPDAHRPVGAGHHQAIAGPEPRGRARGRGGRAAVSLCGQALDGGGPHRRPVDNRPVVAPQAHHPLLLPDRSRRRQADHPVPRLR